MPAIYMKLLLRITRQPGKTNFLNIALKNADLVCSAFGPDKKHVAPGHEIVEMGLVKLYRITGKNEYLQTAKFFIEERGHYNGYDQTSKDEWKNGSYWQDDKPVVDQDRSRGHAVRAGYLYSAVADVAALTGDRQPYYMQLIQYGTMLLQRKCMCREVLALLAMENDLVIIMNCLMQQHTMKPVQPLRRFSGTTDVYVAWRFKVY